MPKQLLQLSQSQSSHWWSAYGPFPPGEGDMPHVGRVVAAYRELREWNTERLLVFASKGGAPTGEERDRLFAKQAELNPQFAAYQEKTTRKIPVIALERSKG